MKKLKKQELVESLNLLMGATGIFIILLGVSLLLGISEYLILLLIAIGLILLIWKSLIERKSK